MYGTNGTGSVLGASASVVASTASTYFLAKSHLATSLFAKFQVSTYVKGIALLSYTLIIAVLISFIAKKIVLKRASKR